MVVGSADPPSTPCRSSSVAFRTFRTSVVMLRKDTAECRCKHKEATASQHTLVYVIDPIPVAVMYLCV